MRNTLFHLVDPRWLSAIAIVSAVSILSVPVLRAEDVPEVGILVKWTSRVDSDLDARQERVTQLNNVLGPRTVLAAQPLVGTAQSVGLRSGGIGLERIWKLIPANGVDVYDIARRLTRLPNVEYAEVDAVGRVAGTIPKDPDFGVQWSLYNVGQTVEGQEGTALADIRALDAWDVHAGTLGVVVGIVDSGVDPHIEFADRLLEGIATIGDPFDTLDHCPHGTHIAGIIGAARNNTLGIAGVHDRVWLLPVRVMEGCTGVASTAAVGVVWAVDHGADVIVIPLQFFKATRTLADAVEYAAQQNVLVVAPAGNDGDREVAHPAAFETVLAVTATTNQDTFSSFSNYGPEVDLAAPGQDIWSTWTGDDYAFQSGSSFASALAAGAAALIRSYAPALTEEELRNVLTASADDLGPVGWDERFGAGRLNLAQALAATPEPALRFEHLASLPAEVSANESSSISLRIEELAETLRPGSALLFTRSLGNEFEPTLLTPLGDRMFRADFPLAPCGSTLEYFFVATGVGGTVVFDPPNVPAEFHSAFAIDAQTIFQDDFEVDLGWTTLAEGGDVSGEWVRVEPVGTSAQPGFDSSPDFGRICYVTGQHFGGLDSLTDVDGGPLRLVSPVIGINSVDVEVSFSVWFSWSGTGTADVLKVELSRDGGSNWSLAMAFSTTDGWIRRRVLLSELPELTGSSLRIRFSTSDQPNDSLTEAAVDDIVVRAIHCFTANGDTNGDGAIDLVDHAALINCVTGPGPPLELSPACQSTDFDHSHTIDLRDVGFFLRRFSPDGS